MLSKMKASQRLRELEKQSIRLSSEAKPGFRFLLEFVQKNPLLSLWNAVLFIGGAILLFYHASIGYLPDFSLSDLAGLLASVTIIGLFLITFLTSSCLLPAWVLASLDEQSTGKTPAGTVFSGRADKALLALFPIISWLVIFSLQFAFDEHWPSQKKYSQFFGIPMLAISAGLVCLKVSPDQKTTARLGLKTWSIRSIGLFVWSLFLLVPLFMSWTLARTTDHEKSWMGLAAVTLLLALVNFATYFSQPRRWWSALLLGSAIMIVIPVLLERPLLWPDTIVQTLAIGNRNAMEVVVSQRQCQALAKFGVTCSVNASEKDQISLQNVNVLSRVGTSILLELMVDSSGIRTQTPATPDGLQVLSSTEFERFCPDSQIGRNKSFCKRCDSLTFDRSKSADDQRGGGSMKRFDKYKADLICVQMSIPKDQVNSISWSAARQYNGYTMYSTAEGRASGQ